MKTVHLVVSISIYLNLPQSTSISTSIYLNVPHLPSMVSLGARFRASTPRASRGHISSAIRGDNFDETF